MATTFFKDPAASLDYSVDWTQWLLPLADTIQTSTWLIDGVTAGTQTATTTVATTWVSGGVLGKSCSLVNHMTSAQGRQDFRTINLLIQRR